MSALTSWFPGNVQPVRAGWYEVKCKYWMFGDPSGERIYWRGGHWYLDGRATAVCSFGRECDHWRGLATAPGKGKD